MTIEALLDVNLLIATFFEDHEHHHQALAFVAGLEHFYSCPTTQGGFLRFATRPIRRDGKTFPPLLTMREAHTALADFSRRSEHEFIPDDLPFVTLPIRSLTGHKQWTDAYLLALARKHHLSLATLDGGIANLDDRNYPALVIVPA